jgi:hypothetical protein
VTVETPVRRREVTDDVPVQIVAAGAEVTGGGPCRHRLALGRGRDEATVHASMRASRDAGPSHLTAFCASGGRAIGIARRPLWVIEPGGLPPPDVDLRALTAAS